MAIWLSGSTLVSINKATLCQAEFVLEWMSIFGHRVGKQFSQCNLAIPSWTATVSVRKSWSINGHIT